MSGRGSSAVGRAAAVRGRCVARLPARARLPRRQPREPPSSIRRRRSIRCPTSASNGPTSMRPTSAEPRRQDAPAIAAEPAAPTAAVDDGPSERRYAVAIEGLDGDRRRRRAARGVPTSSRCSKRGARTPANAAQIDRRSRADAELLAELLRSQGYYDAVVEPRIEQAGGDAARRARGRAGPAISLRVGRAAGPRGGRAPRRRSCARPSRSRPATRSSPRTSSPPSVALAGRARRAGLRAGRDRRAGRSTSITRRTSRTLIAAGRTRAGGALRRRSGSAASRRSAPRHVARIARFKPGDPFKRSEVDDLRRALIATGLVASAEVQAGAGRRRPHRRPRRPARAGADAHRSPASSATAPARASALEASWQHRNFFNPEGALTVRGVAGTQEQLLAVQFRRSNFRRRDQVLNLQALGEQHRTRRLSRRKTVLLGGNIERQSNIIWHKKWTWSVGAELLATDERGVFDDLGDQGHPDLPDRRASRRASAMTAATICSTRRRGFRLGGRISPEISARGGSFAYGRAQIDASAYRPVSRPRRRRRPGPARHDHRRRRASTSRRRGASIRAAADRSAATAISSSGRATSTATRSAGAASPNSRSRRASG